MWLPWAIPTGVAAVLAMVFAGGCAFALSCLAWRLPRQLLPGLPDTPGRSHRICRNVLLAFSPLAALACGTLFGVTPAALAATVYVLVIIALAWIDAETGLLPDLLTLPLLWLGLLVNLRGGFVSLPDAVLGAISGYLLLWMVYWGFRLCTGREGMGYGDFKLLAAIGAWLGWAALPSVLLISSVSGLALALTLRATGRMQPGEPVRFGPFLALGGAVTLLRIAAGG